MKAIVVLILVLVEDGFREAQLEAFRAKHAVLILVLVEDGFRGSKNCSRTCQIRSCLNPCSCGRWLQSPEGYDYWIEIVRVLILVLVEDGFRVYFLL